ncbi:hypothetical protein ACFYO1_18985 [Nocardia sp. NPDC006044]
MSDRTSRVGFGGGGHRLGGQGTQRHPDSADVRQWSAEVGSNGE